MMNAEVHLVTECESVLYTSILRIDESKFEFSIVQRLFLLGRVSCFYMFARVKSFTRQLASNHAKQELEDKGHCESCSDLESKFHLRHIFVHEISV